MAALATSSQTHQPPSRKGSSSPILPRYKRKSVSERQLRKMDPNTTATPPPLPAHLPSSPSAPQDRPTFGHKLANGITENQVALRHQSIPPNKGMFGQERLSAGGEANLTGIWAGSTAVYRWKTVCESKSSLKTFEDVWQVPVPKAAMC